MRNGNVGENGEAKVRDKSAEKARIVEELQSIDRRLDKILLPFCIMIAFVGLLSCVLVVRLVWPEVETESWFLGEGVVMAYGAWMVCMMSFLYRKEHQQTKEKLWRRIGAYWFTLLFGIVSVCALALATLDLALAAIIEGTVLLGGILFGYATYAAIRTTEQLQRKVEDALETVDELLVQVNEIQ